MSCPLNGTLEVNNSVFAGELDPICPQTVFRASLLFNAGQNSS